ncbi:SAM-dependent methyltransferase [Herbivorax sp. ANBcel31]|uniref:SAM-dependent methyltransferase n=1 Tax=Herbivorax sp. ANBcel31 TaxID=3069754 RepID=UPI0027AF4B6B|nr:SAM-dependent methyltransferase [Herbivorax sp. ANBcel31]MDQ2085565.1 SAM-dependent methyltransferase [Herbivorax sp. ANBcel31]
MVELKIIGKVKSKSGFEINIDRDYKEAMKGMDGFGHLIVIWWADKVDNSDFRKVTTTEKPYKAGPDTIGIFATRSPIRPNPIGISIIDVKCIDYDDGIIYTSYIDAEDETPVIDIKPYYPCSDIVREVKLPKWCEGLPNCIEDSANFDWSNFFNF